jgi:hypothetical protein
MATSTSMLYTLVPNGGTSGPLPLAIFCSPRLENPVAVNGVLADYALGNWTETLRDQLILDPNFLVQRNAGPAVPVRATPTFIADLDPALWDGIFPPLTTLVRPRVFQDHAKRWIRSYPIQQVETYIQNLYDLIAEQYPDDFPDLKADTPVTELIDLIEATKARLDTGLPVPRPKQEPKQYTRPTRRPGTHPDLLLEQDLAALAASLGASHIPLAGIFQALRFFKRGNQGPYLSKDVPWNPASFPDRPPPPELDFHEALASLGDYPFLLRKLGLLIDCEMQPSHVSATGSVRFSGPAVGAAIPLTPWTNYEFNAQIGFRPASSGDVAGMMLRFDDPKAYGVLQTDPDGNVIKVYDYAVNMIHFRDKLEERIDRNPQARVNQGPAPSSLPALRHAGMMVIRHQRDDRLWWKVEQQRVFETSPNNAQLFADDLLRGYRVDVHDGAQWFSLMRRSGEYSLAGMLLTQPTPDEGYVKAESATSDDVAVPAGSPQPELYTHEVVVNWTNWSLAAEVPGKTITPLIDGDKHQRDEAKTPTQSPAPKFNFLATTKAEKLSLPALRFGKSYQFRARATMIDGSSLAPPPSPLFPDVKGEQPVSGAGVTPPVQYLRYDPVPAPMLLLTKPVTEGESMEELVIRSRGGVGVPEALPAEFDELMMFNPTCVRWVAAPKQHVGMVELHGKFDDLFTQPANVSRDLLSKESGAFDDLKLEVAGPTARATVVNELHQEIPHPPPLPPDWRQGDPLPNGQWYYIRKDDPLLLPYLPDPLANGVAFRFTFGGVKHFEYQPFDAPTWHEKDPFKLVLTDGPGPLPQVLPGEQVEVHLPIGTMQSVRYSSAVVPPGGAGSAPVEGDLTLMGRFARMKALGRARLVANGYQHWMLTPHRTMKCVHAVDKPIALPVFLELYMGFRNAGETFARLQNGKVSIHSESTGEVEVRARWQDWVDDPAADPSTPAGMPHLADRDGHVLDEKVFYGEQPVIGGVSARQGTPAHHELGDTKHRWVYYYLVATSRYREYFPHAFTDWEDLVADPVRPSIIKKKKLITVEGPEFLEPVTMKPLNVLSSARPIPPDVKYLVPTFQWLDTPLGVSIWDVLGAAAASTSCWVS